MKLSLNKSQEAQLHKLASELNKSPSQVIRDLINQTTHNSEQGDKNERTQTI